MSKADDLRSAFAPFSDIHKGRQGGTQKVDLHKVATHLLTSTAAIATAEDPEAAVEALSKSVDEVDAFLGDVTVVGDDFVSPVAKGMPPWLKDKVKDKEEDGEEEDEEKKKAKKAAEESKTDTAKAGEGEAPEVDFDEIAKGDDSPHWPSDMSPKKVPTLKSERITQGEQPIPARPGMGAVRKKFDDSRSKALGRQAPGDRCMS